MVNELQTKGACSGRRERFEPRETTPLNDSRIGSVER